MPPHPITLFPCPPAAVWSPSLPSCVASCGAVAEALLFVCESCEGTRAERLWVRRVGVRDTWIGSTTTGRGSTALQGMLKAPQTLCAHPQGQCGFAVGPAM